MAVALERSVRTHLLGVGTHVRSVVGNAML